MTGNATGGRFLAGSMDDAEVEPSGFALLALPGWHGKNTALRDGA